MNVAGIITQIDVPTTINGSSKLSVRIKDRDAEVEFSLWRASATSFAGTVGDVIHIQRCQVKDFGSFHVLYGNYANLALNENNDKLLGLKDKVKDVIPSIQLSPMKQPAATA